MVYEVAKELTKSNKGVDFKVKDDYNPYTSLPHIQVRGADLNNINIPPNMKLDGKYIIYKKEGIRFKYPIIPYT